MGNQYVNQTEADRANADWNEQNYGNYKNDSPSSPSSPSSSSSGSSSPSSPSTSRSAPVNEAGGYLGEYREMERKEALRNEAYQKGDWAYLAKNDTGPKGLIGKMHLDKLSAKEAFSAIFLYARYHDGNSEDWRKKEADKLYIELFKLAKQAWETKNRRPMTEKDFLSLKLLKDIKVFDLDLLIKLAINQGLAAYNAKEFEYAFFLWLIAADKGHPQAQANIGNCYGMGYGVPKDEAKKIEWWKKAAAQGFAQSQKNLTNMGIKW
jgi:TPR repeat protein